MELEHKEITGDHQRAALEVYRVLGYGFLERVYQRAMQVECITRTEGRNRIGDRGPLAGTVVGDYRADLFVENVVVVELKVAKTYMLEDEPQLLNESEGYRRQSRPSDQLRPDKG